VFGAAGLEPLFPVVAGFEGDVAPEDLLNLGLEVREILVLPDGELLVELAIRHPQIGQDAPTLLLVQVIARVGLVGDPHRQVADGVALGGRGES
jgi:hypothetical protein